MDLLGLVGILLGMTVLVLGNLSEGGLVTTLLNGPAAFIVFGGTLSAVLVQTPSIVFKHAFMRLFWLVFPPQYNLEALLDRLCEWSAMARKNGLISLEKAANYEKSSLAKKGLNLLADGQSSSVIRNSLEMDLYKQEDKGLQSANVYESLGGYAPTIGILGAVLGLMQALMVLDDPSAIGPGIAAAFVATIYGVASANLIFLPLAGRFKYFVRQEYLYNELIIEGLVAIADGEHGDSIRYRYEILHHG